MKKKIINAKKRDTAIERNPVLVDIITLPYELQSSMSIPFHVTVNIVIQVNQNTA